MKSQVSDGPVDLLALLCRLYTALHDLQEAYSAVESVAATIHEMSLPGEIKLYSSVVWTWLGDLASPHTPGDDAGSLANELEKLLHGLVGPDWQKALAPGTDGQSLEASELAQQKHLRSEIELLARSQRVDRRWLREVEEAVDLLPTHPQDAVAKARRVKEWLLETRRTNGQSDWDLISALTDNEDRVARAHLAFVHHLGNQAVHSRHPITRLDALAVIAAIIGALKWYADNT